jgi:hypothetical protein
MIIKEKFRKQRRKRQELTIEKIENMSIKSPSVNSPR